MKLYKIPARIGGSKCTNCGSPNKNSGLCES